MACDKNFHKKVCVIQYCPRNIFNIKLFPNTKSQCMDVLQVWYNYWLINSFKVICIVKMKLCTHLISPRLTAHLIYVTLCSHISAYDRDQNLYEHSLFLTNSMKFPLIMYSKFVWPNLIWLDICLFWPEMSCDWPLS